MGRRRGDMGGGGCRRGVSERGEGEGRSGERGELGRVEWVGVEVE